jgi:hypothetical protein
LCGSAGRRFGYLVSFLIWFVGHWVEFSAIKWLHSDKVGANVIILHKIGSLLGNDYCSCKIMLDDDLYLYLCLIKAWF